MKQTLAPKIIWTLANKVQICYASRLVELRRCHQEHPEAAEDIDVDSVEWPAGRTFSSVNADVPCKDVGSEQVAAYLELHNQSVSRLTKVNKSARSMLAKGFVRTCQFATEGEHVFFKAVVYPEMKRTVLYNVELRLSDGEIRYTRCECAAGHGPHGICKHVTAVLYMLHHFGETGEWLLERSCTELPQQWHRRGKGRILDPNDPVPLDACEKRGSSVLSDPRPPHLRGNSVAKCQRVQMHVIGFCSQKPEKLAICGMLEGEVNVPALHKDHDYLKLPLPTQWVSNMVSLSKEDICSIEKRTRGQAHSKEWSEERRVRLTASSAGRICRAKPESFPNLAAHLYEQPPLKTAAVVWGKKNESKALAAYSEETGIRVRKAGLFICETEPYLAASPDGICDDRVIEVKCPFKKEVRKSDCLLKSGYGPLCEDENGQAQLRTNHPYYYQVQLQMLCAQKYMCDFVIYTEKGVCVVTVPRDHKFVEDMVSKMHKFYEEHYAPLLMKKIFRC